MDREQGVEGEWRHGSRVEELTAELAEVLEGWDFGEDATWERVRVISEEALGYGRPIGESRELVSDDEVRGVLMGFDPEDDLLVRRVKRVLGWLGKGHLFEPWYMGEAQRREGDGMWV